MKQRLMKIQDDLVEKLVEKSTVSAPEIMIKDRSVSFAKISRLMLAKALALRTT